MARVREADGIRFELDREIVADARSSAGDRNIVSHAHADHITSNEDASIVCTPLTAALAEERSSAAVDRVEDPDISLHPSGHILGSAAARIESGDRSYLYTGDVATRDRAYLDGFTPVEADELVIETTYGLPRYEFPPQDEVEDRIMDWIERHPDRTLFLFAYSLGKAQKIQWLAQQATDRPIAAHGSVIAMNDIIEDHTDLAFRAAPYQERKDGLAGNIVVLPSRTATNDRVQDLIRETDGLTAGFSGWAVDDGFRYRGDYDTTFTFSDHCDHSELLDVVRAVDPDQVYTQHGYSEAFATTVRRELGIPARELKRNQSTLDEF